MAEEITKRMSLVAKNLNRSHSSIWQHLTDKGFKVENSPNAKLTREHLEVLSNDFKASFLLESEAPKKEEPVVVAPRRDDDLPLYFRENKPATPEKVEDKPVPAPVVVEQVKAEVPELKVLGKIDLDTLKPIVEKPVEPTVVVVADKPEPKPEPIIEKPVVAIAPQAEVVAEKPQAVVVVPTPTPTKIEIKPTPPQNRDNRDRNSQGGNRDNKSGGDRNRDNRNGGDRNRDNRDNRNNQGGNRDNRDNRNQAPNRDGRGPIVPEKPKPEPVPQKPVHPRQLDQQPKPKPEAFDPESVELIEARADKLQGLKVLGKIELPVETGRGGDRDRNKKKKRKRIRLNEQVSGEDRGKKEGDKKEGDKKEGDKKTQAQGGNRQAGTGGNRPQGTGNNNAQGGNRQGTGGGNNATNKGQNKKGSKGGSRDAVSQTEVQANLKATLSQLGTSKKQNFGADKRREKRKARAEQAELNLQQEEQESKILKVTEFISASDLAVMMDVSVTEVIATCMSMGMFVSINQRLDAEAITIIADEFGFEVKFVSAEEEIEATIQEEEDAPESLVERAPIVTIMGHVDHGKTSLLDYIRKAKVASGEAGGITQHIGAYSVKTEDGRRVAFLDTPGHEAFTAMRARGAKVTDIVVIVIAADDAVMPQTEEAINHAQNAGVPIVFAFSKIDKPGANSEKIREQLAQRNLLVEEWGGKYQTQELSSKSGLGVNELLEKVLLEAELLELKANPNKRAVGTVIEASLDKGRGYLATMLVQEGTLNVGDVMLAGPYYGKVKAMFDHRGNKIKTAGPATPVQVLGLGGAPAAGDKLNVLDSDRDARELANKREQIMREQSMRTRKHITLEEIGRRKAIGTFKELNVIIKGDVDGSVEALTDSLLKLSTDEVQVRIIHKGVGQVSESDVLLASTADAVIVAFQVRPSPNAKRLADQEQIEIRNYSIIYQAIDDVRDAMEGLLEPTMEETVTANIEVRDVFKISKVGTVAGCYVLDGTAKRNNKVRVIRDFVVVHEGDLQALRRFKDDVAEVKFGYECGVSIRNYQDFQVGDMLECYELKEVKRKL